MLSRFPQPLPLSEKSSCFAFVSLWPGSGVVVFSNRIRVHDLLVEGCAQPVTAITYSKAFHRGRLFGRGVAFVRGEYSTREIPSRDCVILPHLSGFDAYFEAILTCENGTIVINSSDGLLESPSPSKAIISRALNNSDYLELRETNASNLIKLH